MKLLTSLIITLALIIGLGFWNNHSLQKSTDKLTGQIERITEEIDANSWIEARQQTARLDESWHENAKWWPLFLDHQEIDNIQFSLAKVKKYVATRNTPLAQGQLSELNLMLQHIPEKQTVNIENIF